MFEVAFVPLLPFAAFCLLLLFGGRLTQNQIASIGVLGIALSGLVSVHLALGFSGPVDASLWQWMPGISLGFRLDAFSLCMITMVSCVASLIALFSTSFMRGDDGYRRFFAVMNLFVSAMLTLVLADNLLLLFLGWEGVGLCSYLLIGHWQTEEKNGLSAIKAFVTTRIGDVALLVGMLLIYTELRTLNIAEILAQAPIQWGIGSQAAALAALCILIGAVGKSAQMPLQTWLPDAMVGPTPVSALIHAATMVTAGVYLIARMSGLFALAPAVQHAVLIVGVFTLLLAGFSALTQRDIKRVLAYSTISQLGYMFLALGAGAYTAAVFHLLTHAFFKALLFLGAGVIGHATHEYDMYRLGGLRKSMPITFWAFVIGSASLVALPLVTSGYFSKEWILSLTYMSESGGIWPWAAGVLGAFVTAVYTTRMIVLAFLGDEKTHPHHDADWVMAIPLGVLAIFATLAGYFLHGFDAFVSGIFAKTSLYEISHQQEWLLLGAAVFATLSGISLSYFIFRKRPEASVTQSFLPELLTSGFGFDALYRILLVKPYLFIASLLRADLIRSLTRVLVWLVQVANHFLSLTQTGKARHYATVMAAFTILFVWMLVNR